MSDASILDALRYIDFALFGIGCAFMLITNILAFRVLRPPKQLGFLWWHVTSISLSFLCLGSTCMWLAFQNLGSGYTWRTFAVFIGFALFAAAQLMIFTIELQRYAAVQAARGVAGVATPGTVATDSTTTET